VVNGRSGYPAPKEIFTPTRANAAGTAVVYLAPQGENRLPTFHNVDFRIDKAITWKTAKVTFSADVFKRAQFGPALLVRKAGVVIRRGDKVVIEQGRGQG